jgi:hypothetical protein
LLALSVKESDEQGLITAHVAFETDQMGAAHDELEERFANHVYS